MNKLSRSNSIIETDVTSMLYFLLPSCRITTSRRHSGKGYFCSCTLFVLIDRQKNSFLNAIISALKLDSRRWIVASKQNLTLSQECGWSTHYVDMSVQFVLF